MKAELKGENLVLTIPLNAEFVPSSTGKMLLCGYIPWCEVGVKHKGNPLRVTVTIGTRNPDAPDKSGKTPIAGRYGRPEGVTA